MFLVGLLSWWYGPGWRLQLARFKDRLGSTAAFFSIGQLFSTLFSPFRQISAGSVKGGINVVFRAFLDKMISRLIGAFVRSATILIGGIIMTVQAIAEVLRILFWLVTPALPVVGIIVMSIVLVL